MADRIKNYQQEADQITTLKAIRTDLGVTPSSYTPDATVVTKDRVVTFAQAEEELVVLSDIEKGVKQQIVDVDIAQKDISNIKALLQGNLYDYQTDTNSAYTKSVPSGAMPYAGLEKVGGKTVVWNQQFVHSMTRNDGYSYYGLVETHTTEGFTLIGTPSRADTIWYVMFTPIAGHKYLIKGTPTQNDVALRVNVNGSGWASVSENFIVSPTNTTAIAVAIQFTTGIAINLTWKPQIYDLTIMFGSGNEPSTVAEFDAMFPADYYAYNAGTLLSAGVTSVVSKDANNATLQTYPIPASIQALEGYGWSAGSVYNYIDYEAKKYVQEVGSRAYASGDESDSTVITDGTTTYYPLITAVETDISAYLTDDNLIQVEANGTITFPNSNGTDYQIPVPSEEEYMIDLQSAL